MSLLNLLKTNENARKIFGKRELKIIEKQLLGINLTQSEKNRLSRDIRKKFEVIKDLSQYSSEFGLKRSADIKEMINEAKEIILENKYFSKIKEIILFGSAAENMLSLISDIDIAVKFDEISVIEATKFRIEIAGKVNERIDIQVYNILPNKIKREIDQKGKVLYERQDK